ncbi:fibronectin type III domain-containing protein [Elusimicrobiota bacterium]
MASTATSYGVHVASNVDTLLGTTGTTSFVQSGLSTNTAHGVVVEGLSRTCVTRFSPATTAYTMAAPPTEFTVTGVSADSAALSWSANTNPDGTVFQVQASSVSGFFPVFQGTTTVAVSTGLLPATTYTFRIWAINGDGVSVPWDGSISTMTSAVAYTPYGAALGVSSIAWTWNASTNAVSYNVYVASNVGTLLSVTGTTNFIQTGLSTNAAYGVVVEPVGQAEAEPLSPAATIYTLAVPPAGLAVTPVSSTTISLGWSANTNPAQTSYEVQRSTGEIFATVATLATVDFSDISLLPSTTYVYRVRALNGDSVPSTFAANASTTTLPPFPEQVAAPVGAVLGTSSISWTWAASTHAASFEVFYATDTNSLIGATDTTGYLHTALTPNTSYSIVVQAINVSGASALSGASAEVATLIAPPIAAGITFWDVHVTSMTVSWGANGNPIAITTYTVVLSTGGTYPNSFLGNASISTAPASTPQTATFTSLENDTTYYLYVEAIGHNGQRTDFTTLGSTSTSPPVPGQAGAPVGTTLGISSISWSWTASTYTASYSLFQSSSLSTLVGATGTNSSILTGLTPNTSHSIVVRPISSGGEGMLTAASTEVWTLAAIPSGSTVTAVHLTSATLSWGLNGNPSGTTAKLERSTNNATFGDVYAGGLQSFTDPGLSICTTYYYKTRNQNVVGTYSDYDSVVQFTTKGSTPLAPSVLEAVSLSGNKIALGWTPSPSNDITQYRLYYDNGAGVVDYSSPLAVFASTETTYITGILTSSAAYKFALRALNHCNVEESNMHVLASAGSVASLSGVRAAIRTPSAGKRVKGNRVTVAAELIVGSPLQAKQVLFQYRPSSSSAWSPIVAANANHLNPDLTAPYFIHWDATSLPTTNYDLRAVATDVQNETDAAPPSITISVTDHVTEWDINESLDSGKVKQEQKISNAVANTIRAAGQDSSYVSKITISSGAVSASTVTITVVNNPTSVPPMPVDILSAGVITEVTLSNAQTDLSSGKTALVTLSFPDANSDGIVDGTAIRVSDLEMYSAATVAGPWIKDLTSVVNSSSGTVSGLTTHFSFFALFGPGAASDLSAIRIYPNPFMPNSGNADDGTPYSSGDVNSGITIDNLPSAVSIKIFTITGQLVDSFSAENSSGRFQWDVKNKVGQHVASGGYFAVIESPGYSPVVKKLLIVR